MEPRYLLDTNICISIRQKRPELVLRRFRKLRSGEAALSVINYGELLYGAAKSEQRAAAFERLRELVNLLPALSLPETVSEIYGRIRAELESKGKMIGNHCCPGSSQSLSPLLLGQHPECAPPFGRGTHT
jgi:tRNA(fMet)-specific endonuclease VapC